MVAAARLSVDLNLLSATDAARLIALIDKVGLPTRSPGLPETDALMEAMTRDKKVHGGHVRLILLDGLGKAIIRDDVDPAMVRAAWESIRK